MGCHVCPASNDHRGHPNFKYACRILNLLNASSGSTKRVPDGIAIKSAEMRAPLNALPIFGPKIFAITRVSIGSILNWPVALISLPHASHSRSLGKIKM